MSNIDKVCDEIKSVEAWIEKARVVIDSGTVMVNDLEITIPSEKITTLENGINTRLDKLNAIIGFVNTNAGTSIPELG